MRLSEELRGRMALVVVLLSLGIWYFRRREKTFADAI
jgi:hypothetical protein